MSVGAETHCASGVLEGVARRKEDWKLRQAEADWKQTGSLDKPKQTGSHCVGASKICASLRMHGCVLARQRLNI